MYYDPANSQVERMYGSRYLRNLWKLRVSAEERLRALFLRIVFLYW